MAVDARAAARTVGSESFIFVLLGSELQAL